MAEPVAVHPPSNGHARHRRPRRRRVSVALCTCDGERFLLEQLRSIAGQTRPPDELVVCDDASADGTPAVVRAFAAEADVPVRWFRNDRRLGVTRNFERAVSLCTGDRILFCDQDDLWHPDKVAVLTDALDDGLDDRPPAALAFSDADLVDDRAEPTGHRLWPAIGFTPLEQRRVAAGGPGDAVPVLLRHAVVAGSTLAFDAGYLPLVLPMPDLPHVHDTWVALLLACVGRLAPVGRPLIRYRLHTGNTVGMRPHGLLGQVRMARRQIETDAFATLADLCDAARGRLLACRHRWPVTDATLDLLCAKADHCRRRHALPRRWLRRLGTVGGELRRGNYVRYSYGYKSVLQDLFLR